MTSASVCRQAQLQQGHEEYQSVARREQREQERRRADQARDAERKNREEVRQHQVTVVPCNVTRSACHLGCAKPTPMPSVTCNSSLL